MTITRSFLTQTKKHARHQIQNLAWISTSTPALSSTNRPQSSEIDPVEAFKTYEKARIEYKHQVSRLRKQYMAEVEEQRLKDAEEKEKERRRIAYEVGERRKAKLARSIANAKLEKDFEEQKGMEFEMHLQEMERARSARKERFRKAKMLLIAELEEEAPLWMTSEEEVRAVFEDEAKMQELWTTRNSIGAIPEQGQFWRFQSHSMDMSKLYPLPKNILLEEMLEEVGFESDIDKSYWTSDKLDEMVLREQRAKLRAMVRREGRRVLLRKQLDMLKVYYTDKLGASSGSVPINLPPPNLKILANEQAMEDEGAEILLQDPEKFLILEDGAVLGVKDEFYDEPDGRPYPLLVGVEPAGRVSAKLKKQQARDQQLRAAAAAASDGSMELEDDSGPEYAALKTQEEIDPDDWEADIDPSDTAALSLPSEDRLREEDIDWVIDRLNEKVHVYKERLAIEEEHYALEHKYETTEETPTTAQPQQHILDDSPAIKNKIVEDNSIQYELDPSALPPEDFDIVQYVQTAIASLSDLQRETLRGIDVERLLRDGNATAADIATIIRNVCDDHMGGTKLSEEQILAMVMLEMTLVQDKQLRGRVLMQEVEEELEEEEDNEEDNEEEDDAEGGAKDENDDDNNK